MIGGIGNRNAGTVFNNSSGTQKNKETSATNEQKETRVDQLRTAIEKGEYKVDLDKLARKMAEDLS